MLVLSRKEGQKIHIDPDGLNVVVEVLAAFDQWGGVKLGITAPSHVVIHREEVLNRIRMGVAKV